jgi:autotransporter-associated beta strand protein
MLATFDNGSNPINTMKPRHHLPLLAILAFAHTATAQDVIKANNSDALDQTTSWSGGNVPGTSNVAVWDSAVTAANNTVLGSDLSWQGIRIADPGGKVSILRPSAPGNTLTLGSAGIDASAATVDLLIENKTVIGASQTWQTASGRWIEQGSGGKGGITFNADTTLTLSGSGIVGLNTPSGSGNLVIDGAVFQAWSGTGPFTGTTTLNSGRIRIGSGSSPFITTGSGALILNGGVIGSISTVARTIPKAVTIGGDIGIATPNDGGTGFTGTGFSTGTMTFSGPVDLNGGTRTLTCGVTTTISGLVSNGGLIKAGSANLTLSNAGNTFSGPLGIVEGIVTVSGLLAAGNYPGAITNDGTLSFSGAGTQALSGNISGLGGLDRSGTGTLALDGTNTFTGPTNVTGGTLLVNGSLTSDISLSAGARIGGTGSTTGSLTMGSGALIGIVGGATTTGLTVNGATFEGFADAEFITPPQPATTYDVLTYGAGGVVNPDNLAVFARGTLTHDTANNKFTFTTTTGPATLTWNTTDGFWDALGTDDNWSGADTKFYQHDSVIFGDIASDVFITKFGSVRPSGMVVSNSANTYTFEGSGSISGSTALTKSGDGTLVLATSNSYTGTTTINGGTLRLGGPGALGDPSAPVVINPGATLDTNGQLIGGRTITLAGGRITNEGANQQNTLVGGSLNVIANSTIGGTGRWDIRTNSSVAIQSGVTLTKDGSNLIYLSVSPGTTIVNDGLVEITEGELAIWETTAISGSGSFRAATGGTLTLQQNTNNPLPVTLAGGTLLTSNTAAIQSGPVTLSAAGTLDIRVATTISGAIGESGGSQSLTKVGTGTVTLAAANTYTGETTVSAGTLRIQQPYLADSAAVTVATGATLNLDFTGTDLVGALTLGGTPMPAGTYNATTHPGLLAGTGSLQVGGSTSDYDDWAGPSGFNLTQGPTGDDDGDGVTNFEEYAFGLNPTSGSSVSSVTAPNKTAGTFTYTRRKPSLTGLTYTYKSSTTLAGWSAFTQVSESSNSGDPVETITVTIPAALLTEPKLFLRVEAAE